MQEVNRTDLIHGAIEGMLNSIDPHSTFIDLEKFKMMQEEFQGEFGGIGIQIGVRDKRLTVIAPIEDTPADKAGLRAATSFSKSTASPPWTSPWRKPSPRFAAPRARLSN